MSGIKSSQCSEYGELCKPYERQPCCNSTLSCMVSHLEIKFFCMKIGDVILDQSCSGNEECQGIPYAHCSEGKCQCKPQHNKLNDTACAPILGIFCWSDSPCADINAVCIDHRCQCRAGFLAQSHDKCINNFLESSCKKSTDCDGILHSKCSDKECTCLSGYIPVNKTTCAPLLGEFCWRSEKCAPDNSVCVNNECQCSEDYSRQSNDRCLPTSLGQFCRFNKDCNAIKYSVCSENTCICQPNSVPAKGNRCKSLLGGVCGYKIDCFPRNGLCVDQRCQCRHNVLPQSNAKCTVGFVKTTYAKMRRDDPARCSANGTCTCEPKHAALNDTICAPGLGEGCNYLCLTDNAACIDNKCQCKSKYAMQARKFCKPTQLHLACAFDVDCNDVEHAKCSNGKCVCREKYAEVNVKTCRPLLGGSCRSDSDCFTDNASCIDNQCQCNEYFVAANNSCLPIEKFCNVNADCSDIESAECSDNVCKCKPNFRRFNSIVCELLLGGSCISDEQCRIPNSSCLLNKCQCTEYYVANSKNRCTLFPKSMPCPNTCKFTIKISLILFTVTLGQPCIDNDDCNTIPHAVCSNKICACNKNFIALDEETCLPVLGGHCLEDLECRYNTTECINNKCQCKESFKAVSSHQCRNKSSIAFCKDVTECGDRWHYQCSDGKCICADDNILVDIWTCSPMIGGACWADHQCVVENSSCVDFRCQCKPNYVVIANNLCFKNNL
ncbi:prion-like-(Q/N-rich) domain-bearing protein 25 [Cotesia glomerata]|uniref:prion-like-(Q/N-rich) domain-bearing protein 25 n=1 Tax=Cotesia glomerata TaxID=32391 RepID=UPI001D01ACE1|nr:prion-like-(Q/N-rich) domain-bearing protein 25 [Cotesia glomerata]